MNVAAGGDSALSTLNTSESLLGVGDDLPQRRINDNNSEGSGQATLSNKIQFVTRGISNDYSGWLVLQVNSG